MNTELASVWKGSKYTMSDIAHQIAHRFGEEALKEYDPQVNCFTFKGWNDRGYKVKAGEKALRTVTFVSEEKVILLDGTEAPHGKS